MTLEEAAERIGQKVVYRAAHSPAGAGRPRLRADEPQPGPVAEEGVITSVRGEYVFVRYGADAGSKATHPEMLEAVAR
jgi:hypothetical protein